MMPIFLPIFIVTIITSSAAEKQTKEHSNEKSHNHSDHEEENAQAHGKEAESGHKHSIDEKEGESGHSHVDADKGHNHAGDAHQEEDQADEESASVGPDKGIIEANDKNGFKLSPEALKNFELKFIRISGHGPWPVPGGALVLAGEEVNLFRLRDGFFKRIDFKSTKKSDREILISSKDLVTGDQIVVAGLGFLRIAELAAFGGVSHGHSH